MSDPNEGRTATSKDGRTVVYRGGQWVAMPPAANAPSRPVDSVERRQAAALLAKEQPQADEARDSLARLGEFEGINNRIHPRGGLLSSATNTVRGWLGNTDIDRANQLSSWYAVRQRRPGSGSSSDLDQKMYNGMVGGLDHTYATNQAFIASTRRQAQDYVDRHAFRQSFVAKYGTLLGADAAYDRMKKAPPSTRKSATDSWSITQDQ